MNYKNLNHYSTSQVKALFGFHPRVLGEILACVLPELARRRAARLAARPERKRPVIAHDGKPPRVLPLHKVLMTLLDLRHNVSHAVVGALFEWSADSSENAFHEVLPVLRDLFPAEKWAAEKRWRPGEPSWTPTAIELAIVDRFETPVRRPSDPQRQRRLYSGKKRRHPLKTQLVTDQGGEILTLSAGHRGPKADVKIYEDVPLSAPLATTPRLADKGYASPNQPELTTPDKKPRGGELTETQRAGNQEIARQRIVVEHAIRRVKGFRIMREDYRLAVGLFPMIASAVVGLIQCSRMLS